MGSGIFSIGSSALQNAQLALATTSHNIANASTEGYSRQRIIQASNVAVLTGSGYVGTGAHVSTIERVYSSYISTQINSAQAKVSSLESYSTEISSLDSLLSDEDSGMASALEDFFDAIGEVSSDPSSETTRQTMVSAAETLASRFQSLSDLVAQQYQSVNSQVEGTISSINSYASQIASLNKQIIVAESANGQPPNDLYDQRDQLVNDLNELIGVTTTTNSNGSYNVFFGNGQPLVTGTSTTSLVAVPSSEDPSRLTVGIETNSGGVELPESVVTGGSLAGLLEYRSETLDSASGELGRIAASVALTFNAQHALGQDLLGNIAGDSSFVSDFFTISTPVVVDNTNNTGDAVVSASLLPASYNTDSGTFYTNLTGSDYRLEYDGTDLTLTRLSDNTSWTAGSASDLNALITSEGFEVSIPSGTLSAGDSFLIRPTGDAAESIAVNDDITADVRLIAVAAPVRTEADSDNTGSATITEGSVVNGYSTTSLPVTLTYDSSTGNLSGFSSFPVTLFVDGKKFGEYSAGDPVPYKSGGVISFDNISFTISGTPGNGDSFVIESNTNGVSDNRNALLLAQLQTGKTMTGNTASFATVYATLVSDVGNKASEVDTLLAAQETILTEAEDARQSLSGVNLDEEAINLLEYQQAYQAAAKVLEIASTLFDSILALG